MQNEDGSCCMGHELNVDFDGTYADHKFDHLFLDITLNLYWLGK
jgi:hypothetical protein